MTTIFLIIVIVIILFVVLMLSHLKIKIYGELNETDLSGRIEFLLYGLSILNLKLGGDVNTEKKKYSIFRNRNKFYKCLKNYKVNSLEVNSKIGLDDAALTAVTTGTVYSVFSVAYAILANYIRVENVMFNVVPDFYATCFEFDFKCIIDVKVVNIIVDVLHVWVDFTREKIKNSEKESLIWLNIL